MIVSCVTHLCGWTLLSFTEANNGIASLHDCDPEINSEKATLLRLNAAMKAEL